MVKTSPRHVRRPAAGKGKNRAPHVSEICCSSAGSRVRAFRPQDRRTIRAIGARSAPTYSKATSLDVRSVQRAVQDHLVGLPFRLPRAGRPARRPPQAMAVAGARGRASHDWSIW